MTTRKVNLTLWVGGFKQGSFDVMLLRYLYFWEILRNRSPAKTTTLILSFQFQHSSIASIISLCSHMPPKAKFLILYQTTFSKLRRERSCSGRVQVSSIVLRLARSRIKPFQYLRLTHINLRMAVLKVRASSLAYFIRCTEKQAVCGMVILNSIQGDISLFNSIFAPNQDIRSIGGEIMCSV